MIANIPGQNPPNHAASITAMAKINSGAPSPRSGSNFRRAHCGERDTQDRHAIRRQLF